MKGARAKARANPAGGARRRTEGARAIRSGARQEVVDLLVSNEGPMSAEELAEGLGKPLATVRGLLWRMTQAGQLTSQTRGRYEVGVQSEMTHVPPIAHEPPAG